MSLSAADFHQTLGVDAILDDQLVGAPVVSSAFGEFQSALNVRRRVDAVPVFGSFALGQIESLAGDG